MFLGSGSQIFTTQNIFLKARALKEFFGSGVSTVCRESKLGLFCIMEDAEGRQTESIEMAQSRKQDRNDSLLGWWVYFVLILPTLAWRPGRATELAIHGKGGRGVPFAELQKSQLSPSFNKMGNKMNWGSSALSAPTSPARRVPVIDRSKVDPQLLKSAEGMEAMYLDYMMKVMRQTIPKNEMDLESPATQIFRGMLDSSLAEKAAHRGGIGLADQIIAYLSSQGYNYRGGQGVSRKEKP